MHLRALVFSLAVALVATSCDKIPLFAPSGSSITLSAPKRTLALNESVEITAIILEDSGNPVQNGTHILFTSTLGSVSPFEVEARNGIATAIFVAGAVSGTAEVRASSGAAGSASTGQNATATNLLTFTIGAAAVDGVSVRTNPSSVSPQGGTVTVTATVVGASGQGLPGVPVTFTASRGTLSASTGVTDASGVATVQLTTNVETTVTASAGTKTSTAATVSLLGTPAVTLTCAGTAAASTACSQATDQPVTFTAARGTGTSPIQSSTLSFGDGTSVSLGTLSSATTHIKAYTSTGSRTATLTATDVNGEVTTASVAVTITPRAPLSVNITTGTPTTVVGQGQSLLFTATVLPTADAASVVSYAWTFGDGSTATTSGTQTSHVYTINGRKDVSVVITTSDGRTATGQTQILVSGI